MISMDIAGLLLIVIASFSAGRISAHMREWFSDWDWFMEGGLTRDIKHWFKSDFFGTK